MHLNKPTLVASILYTLSDPKGAGGKQPLLWTEISDAQRAPFLKLSDFLGQYVVGSQPQDTDRAKLAAVLEGMMKGTPAEKVNANYAVALFLNVSTLMV